MLASGMSLGIMYVITLLKRDSILINTREELALAVSSEQLFWRD